MTLLWFDFTIIQKSNKPFNDFYTGFAKRVLEFVCAGTPVVLNLVYKSEPSIPLIGHSNKMWSKSPNSQAEISTIPILCKCLGIRQWPVLIFYYGGDITSN